MPASWLLPALKYGGVIGGGLLSGLLAGRRTKEEKAATEASTRAMTTLERLSGQFADISLPSLQAGRDFWATLAGVPTGGSAGGLGGVTGPVGLAPGAPRSTLGGLVGGGLSGASIGALAGGMAGGAITGGLGGVLGGAITGSFLGPVGIVGGAAVGAVKSLIGRGRREANQIVPTQNFVTAQFGKILDALNARREAGTATAQDFAEAEQAIGSLRDEFFNFVEPFGRAGPGARTTIGPLADQIIAGLQGAPDRGTAEGGGEGDGASAVLRSGTPQRQAIERLLSVPIQQLSVQYETAKSNIMNTMPPGGQRDRALADLEQSRTAALGNLFVMAPQIGAEQLTNIGMGVAPMSISALSNLLWGTAQQQLAGAERAQTGVQLSVGIGSILGDLLWGQRGQGGGGGSQMNPLMSAFSFG